LVSHAKRNFLRGFNTKPRAPDDGPAAFFGITESSNHLANESRIAFWAESPADVDRLAQIAMGAGAQNVEGPGWEDETYYAIFFEDPSGNRLEICHRTQAVKL
jgi:predicted lactoylglutathione lyase